VRLLNIKKLKFLHCDSVDLQVRTSEVAGLSGASGSGKSLFLRALADLEEHDGEIILDELNQQSIAAHLWRQKVALLSAETSWWFDTVEEHFDELSESNMDDLEFLNHGFSSLGFSEDVMQWSIARLSSGEKQRLGLLRLLQNKPDVLLLDEPTANLDKHNTQLFEAFVLQYLKDKSACAIWVGHDHEQLQRISTKRYEIVKGQLKNVS